MPDGVTCAMTRGETRLLRNRLPNVTRARLFAKECNGVVLSFALLPDINDLLMTILILSSYELCAFKADGWVKTKTCTFALRMYRHERTEALESYKVCFFCGEEFAVHGGSII